MRLAVVGSGYVGLVAAACFAEIGHEVLCVDSDRDKIAALSRGETPIHEELLPVLLQRHAGKRLRFTTSLRKGVEKSTVVFVAVGTPPCPNGDADVSVLESVCREIARETNGVELVVVKSTVPVGTNKRISGVLQHCTVGRRQLRIASNPEFLREGTAVTDFLYPDRIVLGCDCGPGLELLRQVYEPLLSGLYAQGKNALPIPDNSVMPPTVIETSSASAELIKHASNAFLAMKVSFINAIANICEANGADIAEVVNGIGSDQRIGNKFLNPGLGYGGSCFPKDLAALQAVSRRAGCDFPLLQATMQINEDQRRAFVDKVRQVLWSLPGKHISVLGLAFKGGTDDVRESPAMEVVRSLLKEGCTITAYDPAAAVRAAAELPDREEIRFAESAYQAASGADALLILTDWDEFASLDLGALRDSLKQPIIFDGRNMYSLEEMDRAGFTYISIGRPQVTPGQSVAVFSRDAAA